MIKKKVSLIGFGSIGKKHFSSLRKFIPEKNIQIISSQDLEIENISKNIQDLDKFDPDIIIDCTPTYQHLKNCNYIEKSLKNKCILVEKPIFVKNEQFSSENNMYFCAYNLRFHPFIEIIKEITGLALKNFDEVSFFFFFRPLPCFWSALFPFSFF